MAKPRARPERRLLADVPVGRPDQDQLGRLPFVRALAKTIKSMKGLDSFVFGLCGPWGSGKSSVLNLVVRELEAGRSGNQPVIVKFNPWWFSGQDQLLRAFLLELGSALGRVDTGARAVALGSKLATLSKILRPFSWIPGGSVIGDVSEVLQAGGEATRQLGQDISADLGRLREEIDELLRQQDRRIVIVMDDIDRLVAQEISQLFLIVKAVADFPNTVYLLAFDHAVVAKAIEESLHLDGASYLEKIVQVQIDIPPASPVHLQSLFLSQLDALLGSGAVSESSRRDFGNLFYAGVKEFFKTPRSVKRLTNVLRVLYPAVQGEVYWPDFVGIVSLMVFAPDAFRTIRDNRALFTGVEQRPRYNEREDAATFHKEWIASLPACHRDAVVATTKRLFPRVASALGGFGHGEGWESRWQADLRICSADCFDRYLQLRVPEGEFSEAEWTSVIGILDTPAQIDERIRSLCKERSLHSLTSRAKEFLDRAHLFAQHQASMDQARRLFEVLLRNGDDLLAPADVERIYLVPISNEQRLSWAMLASLSRIEVVPERETFLEQCYSTAWALRAGTFLVWLLGTQHGQFGSKSNRSDEPLVSEACVDRLVQVVLARLQAAANNGTLAEHPKAFSLAFDWRRFGGDAEARKWIDSLVGDDRKLVWLLSQAKHMSAMHGGDDRVLTEIPTINASDLLTWFDGIELRRRAVAILKKQPGWLTADGRQTLDLVLATIDETGKALDPFEPRRARFRGGKKPDSSKESDDVAQGQGDTKEGQAE